MSVFSTPCVPMPDTEFDQFYVEFISGLPTTEPSSCQPQKSMQQPPQQPMFDDPDDDPMGTEPGVVLKREQESGFLDAWGNLSLEQIQTEDMDMYSPEQKKRIEHKCVKTELQCHLKLKMLNEGKEFSSEAEDMPASKNYPISEETKELQRLRRQKNREAAKKCRQKKKASEREQEQKLRETQKEIRDLQGRLDASQLEYNSLLNQFRNLPCFLAYLRQNRNAMKSPLLKPLLQKFVQTHGGIMSGGAATVNCCSTATVACRPNAVQPGSFWVEQ